jgi:hypothetical protein
MKKADGEIVYTDGHHWYSDQGVTKLKEPYPKQLTPIIAAYLASLAKDSSSHLDSLNQEMQEAQGHIDKMTNALEQSAKPKSRSRSKSESRSASRPRAKIWFNLARSKYRELKQ